MPSWCAATTATTTSSGSAGPTELGDTLGVAPTAIALAYVLHQQFPTFPLIGPRSIAETASSMAGLSVELSPAQVSWLDLRDGAVG